MMTLPLPPFGLTALCVHGEDLAAAGSAGALATSGGDRW
jgi:hypothetical protein